MDNQHEIIQQNTQQSSGKLAPNIPSPLQSGVTFKNDFGDNPVGIGHFTRDQGAIVILSLAGAFVGSAFGGLPMAGAILLAGLNDIRFAGQTGKQKQGSPRVATDSTNNDHQYTTNLIQVESPIEMPTTLAPRPQYTDPPQVPVTQPVKVAVTRSAYSLILDNPFQSLAAFGAQRTGKSYFLAVVSQELHRRGIPIYAINLARYGEEDDVYWSHCTKTVLGDISTMSAYEANQLIKEALKTVAEFYAQPKAILIFDEWAYAGNKDNAHADALEPLLKLVADKLGTLTSTGIKRGKAIWTIAPEFVASSMQKASLAIKKSALLYVSIAPGEFVEWKGNRIGFNAELFSQVKNNYTIEKPDGIFADERICFINNEWIEMGNLPPLDSTLRPTLSAIASVSDTQPPLPDARQDYSDEEKQQALDSMVAALRLTKHSTLWEFARDELGLTSSEEIKEVLSKIADVAFDYDLTELKTKFRLSSKNDVRYSYAGYSKKVWETHQYTGNICCCCQQAKSEEIHHTRYQGAYDEPAVNLYPVCGGRGKNGCHDQLCHSFENWVIDREDLWGSHNTPEWESKLKKGFELLATNIGENK